MTIDRYTKGVLTVIAGALLYICVMLSGSSVSAQTPPLDPRQLADMRAQPVVVVGWGTVSSTGEVRVTTTKDASGVVRTDPVLPMRVREMPALPLDVTLGVSPEHPLPVGITAVKPGPEWEPIRTKVEPAPTKSQPGGF